MNDTAPTTAPELQIGKRLLEEVLAPIKSAFVGKDEIVDLMGVCLVAGENLFILGPPGTAKSALVYELGRRLQGETFEYLLTRFTEPNELFGPFDIRKLREGTLETNTDGMLPEADLVFLDELLNANSAILNSLLTVLNERQLRRGREILRLPMLMAVGASNHLPEEEALGALFDRFLLRVSSGNVDDENLGAVLEAGWRLEAAQLARQSEPAENTDTNTPRAPSPKVSAGEIRALRKLLPAVSLEPAQDAYLALVRRLRTIGIEISDRRAVKLQRLLAASALLCGRMQAHPSDLWLLQFIWDLEEQQELLRSVVSEAIASAGEVGLSADDSENADADAGETAEIHPRATAETKVDAEQLHRELEFLLEDLASPSCADRLSRLEARIEWVENEEQRSALAETIQGLWKKLDDLAP